MICSAVITFERWEQPLLFEAFGHRSVIYGLIALISQQALTFNRKTALNHHPIYNLGIAAGSRLHKQSPNQAETFHLSQAMHGVLKLSQSLSVATKRLVDHDAIGDLFEQIKKW